jgi:Pup amidohydrolase
MGKPDFLPEVMGVEIEGRATISRKSYDPDRPDEIKPFALDDDESKAVVVDMILQTGGGRSGFTYNGGRFYFDGKAPEYTTPECVNPLQTAEYLEANEILFLSALTRLCLSIAKEEGKASAQVHRRVIDAKDNTFACHDNFSIGGELAKRIVAGSKEEALILAFAAARPLVAGAGLVRPSGLYYSQKRYPSLLKTRGRQFGRSTYEVRPGVDESRNKKIVEYRYEQRDSDNTFEWATIARLGSLAGLLALMKTPLAHEIDVSKFEPYFKPGPDNPMNQLLLQPDGTIKGSKEAHIAADLVREIIDKLIDDYPQYAEELPMYLVDILEDIYDFTDDYKDVLLGIDTIEKLSGRADWATKMDLVQQSAARSEGRTLTDIRSQWVDRRFDHMGITVVGDEVILDHGYARRLRQRGRLATTLDPDRVRAAYTTPPAETRAADRVAIMKDRDSITSVGWFVIGTTSNLIRLPRLHGGNYTRASKRAA